MSQREFENRIRESLSGHRSAMDTDRFFQAIKRKERRRRWFIFGWISTAGASVLLLGLGGLWFNGYFESKSTEPASTDLTISAKKDDPTPVTEIKKESLSQKTSVLSVVLPNPTTESIPPKTTALSDHQMKTTITKKEGASLTKIHSGSRAEVNPKVIISIPQPAAMDMEKAEPTEETVEDGANSNLIPEVAPVQEKLESFSLIPTALPAPLEENAADILVPSVQKTGQWSFILQSGAGLLLRSYQGDAANESNYQTARTVETNLEVLDVTAGLRWTAPKGWLVQVGAGATQGTTRLNWDEPFQTSYIEEDAVLRIIQFPDGTTEEERGSREVIQTGFRHVQHFNYQRSLDLRLQAGYQLTRGDWSLIGLTGASWALWQESAGRVLIGDQIPLYQESLGSQLAWESQIGIRYQWIQPLAFEFGVFHKAPLKTLDYQGLGWKEYRQVTGLRLGIQYSW